MTDPTIDRLVAAILAGDSADSVAQAQLLRDAGAGTERIVLEGVEPAMSALDAKCTVEQFNLLEIMLSGRAVTEVMKVLNPPGSVPADTKGTVLIASLEGDVHDLGKNILKMVLVGNGYRVVDAGRDCPLDELVRLAERERPLAVGVSGLITQVIPLVRKVKTALGRRDLDDVRVLAGGAALKQSSPGDLDVDFVAQSAFDGVHFVERLAGRQR